MGHGLKWFRKWKEQGETDWNAYRKSLSFPDGTGKRQKEWRLLIPRAVNWQVWTKISVEQLAICEQSRGRTPVVHWYNPNAESHAAAAYTHRSYQPNKIEVALEHDLENAFFGMVPTG